ncbi:MAG TPA: hypothetical protein VMD47_08920 [Candidatus Acidoferrales bacterium]|nr:hypothetical protein [Candidatus Acidoferrales bacterium]
MSQLYQRRYLNCPYNRARELLAAMVVTPEDASREQQLRLTLPVPGVAGAELGKDVSVSFRPTADPMGFDEPWTLHWEPLGGGLYPDFDGTLAIRADESYATSMLELKGTYRPPLGAAGAVFDAVVGSRIAHATARELLRTIGKTIEGQYRTGEAAKDTAQPQG